MRLIRPTGSAFVGRIRRLRRIRHQLNSAKPMTPATGYTDGAGRRARGRLTHSPPLSLASLPANGPPADGRRSKSWVTITTAKLSSITRPRSRSSRRACTDTSSPPVGSSINTSFGCVTKVAGNLQTLLHAAGKGGRQVVDPVGGNLHLFQPFLRGGANIAVTRAPVAINRSPILPPADTGGAGRQADADAPHPIRCAAGDGGRPRSSRTANGFVANFPLLWCQAGGN